MVFGAILKLVAKSRGKGLVMAATADAVLHDGSVIRVTVHGTGPALLLPVRLEPYPPEQAETMRKWGGDPDLGPALVAGLSGSNRLIVADYEGHRMAHPAAETLTPENLATDLLAIADAGGADDFGYYGSACGRSPWVAFRRGTGPTGACWR